MTLSLQESICNGCDIDIVGASPSFAQFIIASDLGRSAALSDGHGHGVDNIPTTHSPDRGVAL